jgi:hypothetical protein
LLLQRAQEERAEETEERFLSSVEMTEFRGTRN